MEPFCVGASRNDENDQGSVLSCLETLAHPFANLAAIGWIAEHAMGSPILCQAVLFFGEVERAFCVLCCCAGIECEGKEPIEASKEGAWRRPFGGEAAEEYIH